jgi:hypothetical protein
VEAPGIRSLGESGREGLAITKLAFLSGSKPPSLKSGRSPGWTQVLLRSDCTARTAASQTSASNSEATSDCLHGPQRGPPIRDDLRPEPTHVDLEQRAIEV